jgi:three-Cys-motif partner protein
LNHKPLAQVQSFVADGLSITAVEPWFKVKVQLIERYVQSFIAHVAGRADEIVFVDLTAGSGMFSVGHQKEIFPTASLSLLAARMPIANWYFCERDEEQAYALNTRIHPHNKQKTAMVLEEPLHLLPERLRSLIPDNKRGRKIAVLCLADSFSFEIPFTLVEAMAVQGYSFLIPFTWMMNSRTNYQFYVEEKSQQLKHFAGVQDLQRLTSVQSNQQFYKHLVRLYQNNMLMRGINNAMSVHKLDSRLMDLPAYNIGFFSRKVSTKMVLSDVNEQEHVQFELW